MRRDKTLILDRMASREVDRLAIDEFGIPGIVLMENASRALADAAMDRARDNTAVVVCGPGNNGGDGWAAARHMANADFEVVVIEVLPEVAPRGDAAINRSISLRMEIPVRSLAVLRERAGVVVDALFGTGLERPIAGAAAEAVELMNAIDAPIVAADLPSGLDADLGVPLGVAVRADETVTFAALKPACVLPEAAPWLGKVTVADIGCPAALIRRLARPTRG